MVNPNLIKKTEKPLTITENAKKLFQAIYKDQNKKIADDDVPRIKVSELISKMSFYYEKIRNTVDYNEEHLLRKNAIERILKRQIVIEGTIKKISTLDVSKHLLTELIRAGYLPNNSIPETKIEEVSKTVDKYLLIRKYAAQALDTEGLIISGKEQQEKTETTRWIIALCASEIEETLGRNNITQVVVTDMFNNLTRTVKLPDNSPYQADFEIQVFVAIHRNYLKFDRDMLGHILFKYFNQNWQELTAEECKTIGQDIRSLKAAIDAQLDHPLEGQLNKVVNKYNVYYSILSDVIKQGPAKIYEEMMNDPKSFPRNIKNMCDKRYQAALSKLWRAAFRSILYIFITKSIFAILIEVPATQFLGEKLNAFSLTVNILFPPFLLFLAVAMTKTPDAANTAKIVSGIEEIVYVEKERKDPIKLRQPGKRGVGMQVFFGFLYLVTFFVSFGAIIWVLDRLGFTWVSILIFIFFLTFVSFFTIRIRRGPKEYMIDQGKESLSALFMDFFFTPIIAVGKWLSEKFSKLNVFIFVLDFIIEAPFKIFVEIAEEWTKYVKERRDEVE